MGIRDFLNTFYLGAASGWDFFIALIFLVAVLIYGLFLGRNRMVILLISSYFSLSIVRVLPWSRLTSLSWLGVGEEPSASLKIILFLAIILLFYFLMPRSVLSSSLRIRKRGGASWIQLFVLSIVQVGLWAMVILSFLPSQNTIDLTLTIKRLFIGPEAQFVWITLPILVIVLMRKKRESTKSGK